MVLAARMGLVQGSNWGNYNPDGILSRAQAAVMLHRLLALMGRSEANAPPMWFSDGYSIPAWARESVKFIRPHHGARKSCDGWRLGQV